MKILLLTHAFNSLTQRLHVELAARGHELSVEFDINDSVTREAVELFRPDLVLAPFLRRAIPEDVWRRQFCLVVHPGIAGDRGPSALDWAIMNDEPRWGVTVLQAEAELDAGPVWAHAEFPMRAATKSSLYRNEVTEAAVRTVLAATERFATGQFQPRRVAPGPFRPLMRQSDRALDWRHADTATVLRHIRAADGVPGVLDEIAGRAVYLYDAHPEPALHGPPGAILARRHGAICRATADGAVWLGHLKPLPDADGLALKLPATMVLADALDSVAEATDAAWRDLWYEEHSSVGYLHFPFYNGAMSTGHCHRLRDAFLSARQRPTRVIVLLGGPDFWSNGLHLNVIEAATSPANESLRNIEAMDDLCEAILTTTSHLTIAALQGNAGAGGVFLALAADRVLARRSIVLNPHYKNMGNLYGSEYWTYLLPKRAGTAAAAILQHRLPIGANAARAAGLVDECFDGDPATFLAHVTGYAAELARDGSFATLLAEKRRQRTADEAIKPLAAYRAEEIARLKLNFYGFDPSYHVARHNFVYRVPKSRTPLHLAPHRRSR
jgi:putative two-component system hydrogenase maturation factor HypX/HoxX